MSGTSHRRAGRPLGYFAFRLYKLGWRTGLFLALPTLLLAAWYLVAALGAASRHREATRDQAVLDAELLQIYLHDVLSRDLRRLTVDERPTGSKLPLFELFLGPQAVDALERREEWAPARLKKGERVLEAKVRYRGTKHFHVLGPQRSLKVRLERGELLDGMREVLLLNDPTPFGVEEQLILELARQHGLVTPEYGPVRVHLNNSDLGVYRYAAEPSEGLLRRQGRMPGNVYAGEADGDAGVFVATGGWRKVTTRAGEAEEDLSAIERLVGAVHQSHAEFAAYVGSELDVERYAMFDALDVVFGGADHDLLANHVFYRDPYTGRLEPIAEAFRGFEHEPVLNAVDHPLLVRLKMTPGYLARRNRLVYDLLNGPASVAAVRQRSTELAAALLPDLKADPFWDAYKLLPRVSRFHRFMVRPMTRGRLELAAAAELETYRKRSRFLLDALEAESLRARASAAPGGRHLVTLTVDGHAAFSLRQLLVRAPCQGAVLVHADVDRDGALSGKDELVARGRAGAALTPTARDSLEPGAVLLARPDPSPKHGRVVVVPEARTYGYLVDTQGCRAEATVLVLDNQVTGERLRLEVPVGNEAAPPPQATPPVARTPSLEPKESSPHLWDHPAAPAARELRLGPGLVRFDASRRFGPETTVRLLAGTRLELGPDVTLTFEGRLLAEGEPSRPVIIAAADSRRPFGGLVLLGPESAGSRLSELRLMGGSRASHPIVETPGLVNLHGTRDVTLSQVDLEGGAAAEDVLHVAYSEDLVLDGVSIHGAPTDAVDLEMVSATVRGLRVLGAGDDCLDLMAARVSLADTVLADCANNAVSAGEQSEVNGRAVLIARAGVGVLAKNASRVLLSRSLILESRVALRTHMKELHYAGTSHIGASHLFAVDCGTVVDADRGTSVDAGRVRVGLPGPGALEHLRRVLDLADWEALGGSELVRRATVGEPP